MPAATAQYVVGRDEEVRLLGNVAKGMLPYRVVNIYGPGGIGKTVVCRRFEDYCTRERIPYATVDGSDASITVDKMLFEFKNGLVKNVPGVLTQGQFGDFDRKIQEYLTVNGIVEKSGGLSKIFDLAGNVVDQPLLKTLFSAIGETYEGIKKIFTNRGTLERYLKGANRWLSESFIDCAKRIVENGRIKIVLIVDTYEELLGLDDWMCLFFAKGLPSDVKLILVERNRLNKFNSSWSDYGDADLYYHELGELSEQDAKSYLRHHGLVDEEALDNVYNFTRGYPLCLVLVREIAREVTWEKLGRMDSGLNPAIVAKGLLDRILKEQKVKEVQEFLEEGVVARWFDPKVISYILDLSPEKGLEIFEKIVKFSFVERHPQYDAMKFNDRIREILVERLKFMDGGNTYARMAGKWSAYLKIRAGL